MVIIHRVFRREFTLLPLQIAAVADGDVQRAERIGAHAALLLDVLHHHHEGEDLLLWPRLRERAPNRSTLFDTMDTEHSTLAEAVERVQQQLARWRAGAETAAATELAAAIADLTPALIEHLDQEERDVLPLVNELLTQDEWNELGQRAFSLLTPADAMTVLAQMGEESPDDEWQAFMTHLPEPVQHAYRTEALPAYGQYLAAIRRA